LDYYIYQDGSECILEAIGSLPLHLSTSTTRGAHCPETVPQGGTNELYLCAGNRVTTLRIFPLFNVYQTIPLKFMAFTNATGVASGLLIFRNAIGVDARANGSVPFPGLDGVDFTSRSIKTGGNLSTIVTKEGAEEGDILALFQLLSALPENEGKPVEGGKIKLYLGPPPLVLRTNTDDKPKKDEAGRELMAHPETPTHPRLRG
jgi:hypothetical protein